MLFTAIESEKSLIGSVLVEPKSFKKVKNIVSSDFFTKVELGYIWQSFHALDRKNKPIDFASCATWLRTNNYLDAVGGAEALADLANYVPFATHIVRYADEVKIRNDFRKLKKLLADFDLGKYDEPAEAIREISRQLGEIKNVNHKGRNLHDIAEMYSEDQTKIKIHKTNYLLPIHEGRLHVINAFSSVGKTTLAFQIIWELKLKSVFYSLEMRSEDIFAKLEQINRGMGIPYGDLYDRLEVVDNLRTWDAIEADVMAYDNPPQIIFIDYFQLISHKKNKDNYLNLQDLAFSIQEFVKRTGVGVVLLSQVANSARSNEGHYEAKGGGDLYAACDLFLHIRDDPKSDEKNRSSNIQILTRNFVLYKNRYGRKSAKNFDYDDKNGVYLSGGSEFQ